MHISHASKALYQQLQHNLNVHEIFAPSAGSRVSYGLQDCYTLDTFYFTTVPNDDFCEINPMISK